MKKIGIYSVLIFLIKVLVPIPPYIECNHIHIIQEITITCQDQYELEYKEVIPKKEENGITYQYKTYRSKNKEIEKAIRAIEKEKKFYKDKAKIQVKKCQKKEEILFYFPSKMIGRD